MCDCVSETVPVRFEVRQVEPVRGAGKLLGLAVVVLDVAGVELVLQGVQLVRDGSGALSVRAPAWRHPGSGQWLPALVLPDKLRDAIGAEVLAVAGAG